MLEIEPGGPRLNKSKGQGVRVGKPPARSSRRSCPLGQRRTRTPWRARSARARPSAPAKFIKRLAPGRGASLAARRRRRVGAGSACSREHAPQIMRAAHAVSCAPCPRPRQEQRARQWSARDSATAHGAKSTALRASPRVSRFPQASLFTRASRFTETQKRVALRRIRARPALPRRGTPGTRMRGRSTGSAASGASGGSACTRLRVQRVTLQCKAGRRRPRRAFRAQHAAAPSGAPDTGLIPRSGSGVPMTCTG